MSKKAKIILFSSIGGAILVILIAAIATLFFIQVTDVDMKSAKNLASKFEGGLAPTYLPEEFEYEYAIYNIKLNGKEEEGVSLFNIALGKLDMENASYNISSLDENNTVSVVMSTSGGVASGSLVENYQGVDILLTTRSSLGVQRSYCSFAYSVELKDGASIDYLYEIYYTYTQEAGSRAKADEEVVKIAKSMIPQVKE